MDELAQTKKYLQGCKECLNVVEKEKIRLKKVNEQLQAELKEIKDALAKGFNEAIEALLEPIKAKLDKLRWIPASEGLPDLVDGGIQSKWLRVTDGEQIVDAYYYDYTKEKECKDQVRGKGWYCCGMKRSSITHYRYETLPVSEEASDVQS